PPRSLVDFARMLPHAEDVDPAWIDIQPLPLSNRGSPSPELLALQRAGRARSFPQSDLYRQWNALWAQGLGCRPGGSLRDAPLPLYVFDPPEPNNQPIYRYHLGVTQPDGLVTNQ